MTILFLDKGFSIEQAGIFYSCYMISLAGLEIPTGILADRFGRKRSFLIACLLNSAGMLLLTIGQTAGQMIAIQLVRGLGTTFGNGAIEAWAYDRIKQLSGGEGTWHHSVYKYDSMLRYMFATLGGVLGAWIGSTNIRMPLYIAAGLLFANGIIAAFVMTEVRHTLPDQLKTVIVNSFNFCKKNEVWKFVILIGFLQGLLIGNADAQWPALFEGRLPDRSQLGMVWAGISISVVMGGFISARSVLLQKHYRYGLLFGTALIGLGMVSAVAVEYPIWLSAMLLWVHDVGRGLSDPLRRLALNHEVTNQIRSTVNSSISAALTGFAAIGGVTGSILTNAYGIHNTWVIMGGVIAFSTIPLLLYLRSKEKTEARTF